VTTRVAQLVVVLVLIALALQVANGGPGGVKRWLSAKFLGRP
jgi:hypothetical protein